MGGSGRLLGIAIALVAGAAVSSGPALAGEPSGQLDLTFTGTTTNWTTLPGRAEQATYDPCLPEQRLVGIGAFVTEAVPAVPNRSSFALGKGYNVSIHPFDQYDSPVPDSTRQVADNLFQIDNDLTLGETTVCAGNAGPVSYPSAKKVAAGRARTTARVECAGGRHVLSGGGLAFGPFRSQRLVSSAPFDSDDPGSKPDDGWRVTVDNLKRKRRKIEVHAVCADVDQVSYRSDDFAAKKRSRKHVEVDCPAGEFAISGGVTHTARYRKATLVASRGPFPSPFTSWIAEIDNLSKKRAPAKAFSICHA
jgi:hypothetical protein